MEQIGLNMRYVKIAEGQQTLFSFCFVYPDGSGGNLTVEDSACSKVDAAFVDLANDDFARFAASGIALAAPEVPIDARGKLIALGTEFNMFRIACFTSEEIKEAGSIELLQNVDLLAINVDEAAAAAGISYENKPTGDIVNEAIKALSQTNPKLQLSVTAGSKGSWTWDGAHIVHIPAYKTEVVNTAGAGDAHLSGLIVGLTADLSLSQAQQLATLTASLSVASKHTINKDISAASLRAFAERSKAPICDEIRCLLEV
jgi:sugar/nucleoside kinase (ribokinase family)